MLDKLFNPSSVCVVGVSLNDNKWGNQILSNLLEGGYKGNVYPVNKKGGYINDLVVYKSVLDTPSDSIGKMVVICVPAPLVFNVMLNCSMAGVKNVIIITAGFSEVGNVEEEKLIMSIAERNGINVIGPNTFGVICRSSKLNVSLISTGEL